MWQDAPGEYRLRDSVVAEMRANGCVAGLTYAALGRIRYAAECLGRPAREDMGVWKERMQRRFESERRMVDAGVRYVLHSDCGVRDTPFGEFWLVPAAACFELGIPPLEAIRAVTSTAASLLGMEGDVGTLAPGKYADLLVVEGDPASRIEALANPRLVFLEGRCVARDGVLFVNARVE
jgi:imidazolonepropionase-like amidohydrolase